MAAYLIIFLLAPFMAFAEQSKPCLDAVMTYVKG